MVAVEVAARAYLGSNLVGRCVVGNSMAVAAFADGEVVDYILNTDLGVADASTAAAVGIEGAVVVAGENGGGLAGGDEEVGSEEEVGMMMKLLLKLRERWQNAGQDLLRESRLRTINPR